MKDGTSPEQASAEREMNEQSHRRDFRVSIFGTGSDKTPHDRNAIKLAGAVARSAVQDGGHTVCTGGYESGIMGEVSRSANEAAQEIGRDDLRPEGITLGDRLGKQSGNAKLSEAGTLNERLREMLDRSNAAVVLHGKTGTTVELLTAVWAYAVERIPKQAGERIVPKPVIIADSSLEHAALLSQLSRLDPKFAKYATDVYLVGPSGFESADQVQHTSETVNGIIEDYYRLEQGEQLPEEERAHLQGLSLAKFLKDQGEHSDGGGI